MISAVDSSVILDVVTNDVRFADAAERALRTAVAEGQLVVCECVLAEIRPAFAAEDDFEAFLLDWQFEFVSSSVQSAKLAGAHFRTYLERGGRRGRIVADFLIGAHASLHADRLVARDRGYLRDYFSNLVLVNPMQP
ncbi:type II toxin-antitoxin system VapC family toxin [bacterium]|nr:type II toxin-antitoxin system VapC family toxin [bacterium]